MISAGNGSPEVCVQNILSITRGQAPYLRGMGLDDTLYDQPTEIAKPLVLADAEEQIENYEERVQINDITFAESSEVGFNQERTHIIKPDLTILEN